MTWQCRWSNGSCHFKLNSNTVSSSTLSSGKKKKKKSFSQNQGHQSCRNYVCGDEKEAQIPQRVPEKDDETNQFYCYSVDLEPTYSSYWRQNHISAIDLVHMPHPTGQRTNPKGLYLTCLHGASDHSAILLLDDEISDKTSRLCVYVPILQSPIS